MISIYYKGLKSKTVQKLIEYKANSWVYVEDPSEAESRSLEGKFHLDAGLMRDALDEYEVPRVEIEDDTVYIYTRIITQKEDISVTAPFLLIFKNNYLIIVSKKPFPGMQKFLDGRVHFNTHNTKLLILLLSRILFQYKREMNGLSKKINSFIVNVEKIKNKDILQFVSFENIVSELNSSLIRMESILRTVHSRKIIPFTEDELDLVDDLILETGQLIQIAKDSTRTIVNIREAYSSIMTNNLNNVVTLFTSLTVILTIPTIIGSFFGMNVPVPFSANPYAFIGIVGVTLLITAAVIIVFIRKNWL